MTDYFSTLFQITGCLWYLPPNPYLPFVRGLFNKFQDSCCILHNNKRIKTTIMLFLNILSLQFNTTFLALNKSREACSIEIFISTM